MVSSTMRTVGTGIVASLSFFIEGSGGEKYKYLLCGGKKIDLPDPEAAQERARDPSLGRTLQTVAREHGDAAAYRGSDPAASAPSSWTVDSEYGHFLKKKKPEPLEKSAINCRANTLSPLC